MIEHPGLFPEGVEWNEQTEQFLVGSIAEGTIYTVADDGTATAFIEDDALMSSIGIQVDVANNRLLVCNTDSSVLSSQDAPGQISLGAYDLATGEQLFMADLTALGPEGARFFANDVAVDDEGNAYVTNSFAPVIYKVDKDGNASIFVQDDRLTAEGFGLNGIVFHEHGFLIAAVTATGQLFKIPLNDPTNLSEVTLDAPVTGADGMILDDNGDLFVVSGQQMMVFRLHSDDEWATATTAELVPTEQAATTATLRDGQVYVLFAHLDQMGAATPQQTFEIVHVPFEGSTATTDTDQDGTSSNNSSNDSDSVRLRQQSGPAILAAKRGRSGSRLPPIARHLRLRRIGWPWRQRFHIIWRGKLGRLGWWGSPLELLQHIQQWLIGKGKGPFARAENAPEDPAVSHNHHPARTVLEQRLDTRHPCRVLIDHLRHHYARQRVIPVSGIFAAQWQIFEAGVHRDFLFAQQFAQPIEANRCVAPPAKVDDQPPPFIPTWHGSPRSQRFMHGLRGRAQQVCVCRLVQFAVGNWHRFLPLPGTGLAAQAARS